MAPEVARSLPYSLSSDIWSLGILIYELCTLTPLIEASTMESLRMKVRFLLTTTRACISLGVRILNVCV